MFTTLGPRFRDRNDLTPGPGQYSPGSLSRPDSRHRAPFGSTISRSGLFDDRQDEPGPGWYELGNAQHDGLSLSGTSPLRSQSSRTVFDPTNEAPGVGSYNLRGNSSVKPRQRVVSRGQHEAMRFLSTLPGSEPSILPGTYVERDESLSHSWNRNRERESAENDRRLRSRTTSFASGVGHGPLSTFEQTPAPGQYNVTSPSHDLQSSHPFKVPGIGLSEEVVRAAFPQSRVSGPDPTTYTLRDPYETPPLRTNTFDRAQRFGGSSLMARIPSSMYVSTPGPGQYDVLAVDTQVSDLTQHHSPTQSGQLQSTLRARSAPSSEANSTSFSRAVGRQCPFTGTDTPGPGSYEVIPSKVSQSPPRTPQISLSRSQTLSRPEVRLFSSPPGTRFDFMAAEAADDDQSSELGTVAAQGPRAGSRASTALAAPRRRSSPQPEREHLTEQQKNDIANEKQALQYLRSRNIDIPDGMSALDYLTGPGGRLSGSSGRLSRCEARTSFGETSQRFVYVDSEVPGVGAYSPKDPGDAHRSSSAVGQRPRLLFGADGARRFTTIQNDNPPIGAYDISGSPFHRSYNRLAQR